ncbi:MAG TPA: BatA domain-containing protein, partial [Rariglobus sp.]
MNLLSPGFLFALGAVALPVAIHLLNKTQVKRIRWAASRFLAAALQRNRRRLQLEDLLLLLLRCALLALIALAFARPSLDSGGLNLGSRDATTAVIILDQTASMGRAAGADTGFDQARKTARDILDRLPSGSTAALFLSADRTARVVPQPTADFALLRRTLDAAKPAARGGDLYPAI